MRGRHTTIRKERIRKERDMVKAVGCSLLVGVYLLLALLGVWLLCGCSRKVYAPADAVTLHDTVRMERVERVVTRVDTVEVAVAVPVQSAVAWSVRDSSHLETDVAWSDAWLNADGTLGHRLENKDVELGARAFVPTTEKQTQTDSVTVREKPVPYPVEVERKLTWWEQLRIDSFWWLLGTLAVTVGWIFKGIINRN